MSDAKITLEFDQKAWMVSWLMRPYLKKGKVLDPIALNPWRMGKSRRKKASSGYMNVTKAMHWAKKHLPETLSREESDKRWAAYLKRTQND